MQLHILLLGVKLLDGAWSCMNHEQCVKIDIEEYDQLMHEIWASSFASYEVSKISAASHSMATSVST